MKWAVRKAITGIAGHELDAYVDGNYATEDDQTTDPVSVLRLQIRYAINRSGLQPDVFENVLHLVNTAGELPGAQADNTQKAAVEAAFTTFWSNVRSYCQQYVALSQYRWYHFSFDDPLSGPPTRITTPTASSGTKGDGFPSQVASSLTLRTAERKHWGRIYLPGAKTVGGTGMTIAADVDALTSYFRTFVNACDAADLNPVVYSKARQMVASVSSVEVDDVPDVVRRRRPKSSTYRKVLDTST